MSATSASRPYEIEEIDLTPAPIEPDEEWTIEKLQAADKERAQLEGEIKALQDALTSPGGFGLTGGLVDQEGFPIADYGKVISTREQRQLLARAQRVLLSLLIAFLSS